MTDLVLNLVTGILVIANAFAIFRIIRGPLHTDRVVALDILLATGIGLSLVKALESKETVYLDVAIGLALVAFVATIGWARLIQRTPKDRSTAPRGLAPEIRELYPKDAP